MLQETLLPKQFSAHTVLGNFDSTTVSLKRMLARRYCIISRKRTIKLSPTLTNGTTNRPKKPWQITDQ